MVSCNNVMEILKEELPYLKDHFGVKKIGLFGSFSKGEQTKDSDVDILVEFATPLGFKFIEFAEHIEKILGKKVDILTFKGMSGIRVKQVLKDIQRSILYV